MNTRTSRVLDRALPARIDVERFADHIKLRSPVPLGEFPRCLGESLEHWAREAPARVFLAERGVDGQWIRWTWGDAFRRIRSMAGTLLRFGLSPSRPLVLLSENSVDHMMLTLAAMHVGIPAAPVSPPYSLLSQDHSKLKAIFRLIEPGLVYAADGAKYAAAIGALRESGFNFDIVVSRHPEALGQSSTVLGSWPVDDDGASVERAFGRTGPDTVAKFLFTSGSTGEPKAVVNTQRMLCSNQQMVRHVWPFLFEDEFVLMDWLPWNHTFGANATFNMVLCNGGSFYIDEGKPAPGLIEKTVRNLKEVAPTAYFNVPRGYDMLLPFLESDAELRRNFFSRLKMVMYAAAALPAATWQRLADVSRLERGERVAMISGWGSTETAPLLTAVHFETERPTAIGLPAPGTELKMVLTDEDGKYELRVRGPNITPGYWRQPDLTSAAFDDEGFYKMGDAGRFVDPGDPAQGIEFAGRLAEDFKLTSGVWVNVGVLRVGVITALAPLALDAVITGHDREAVGVLLFPNPATCRAVCPELPADAALSRVLEDSRVRDAVTGGLRRFNAASGGSSAQVSAAVLLEEPPSIDAGEITDKGYINQRAVLTRRASAVDAIYDAGGSGTAFVIRV